MTKSRLKPSFWAGRWYFVITIASFGLLAWVPFAHAATRLRRRLFAVLAGIYGAAAAASIVLFSLPSTDAQNPSGGAMAASIAAELLLLSVIIAGCIQQVSLRREVYGGAPTDGPEAALAAALAARKRRQTARQLAADDPLIAIDLRIGRPDLVRIYDDGGLVDLNNAPAPAIATICDLPTSTADLIVTTRTACGGFRTVDDLLTMVDIPVSAWDLIRDRGIVISPMT